MMQNFNAYKPYMMHSVQQFYDEDMDLCVETSEPLISILDDQRNDGSLMDQIFIFPRP